MSASKAYEAHRRAGSRLAVVTFGSRTAADRPGPSYAFMQVLLVVQRMLSVPFDIFYVVAHGNDWYLGGVRGLGETMADSVAALASLTENYDATLFVGNSMGGYAALAFGWQAPCTRALAFSPQTRFDETFCEAIGEHRWDDDWIGLRRSYPVDAYAVTRLAEAGRAPTAGAAVYVGADSSVDCAYGRDVAGVAGLEVRPVAGSGHDLVRDLRIAARLPAILAEEIQTLAAR